MHPRFYDYYNQELAHIRETAAEFAREYPKIAGRLTLDGIACTDPYVERLLEGFAFMAARIQLKLDAEFPKFTQHLLEVLFPDFLAPVPSVLLVQFEPNPSDVALLTGGPVPRNSKLLSKKIQTGYAAANGKNNSIQCEYRTAHDLTLWPIEISSAQYYAYQPELPRGVYLSGQTKGAIKLKLKITHSTATFNTLPLDHLVFHLSGNETVATKLYEQIFSSCTGMAILAPHQNRWFRRLGVEQLEKVGFSDDEALLPPHRSFRGYRLLREYAALPARFLFFKVNGLKSILAECHTQELELYIFLSEVENRLEQLVSMENFLLNVTPAINLFPRQTDRIELADLYKTEHHIVPDRARPMDYEIFSIKAVKGHANKVEHDCIFRSLYATLEQSVQHSEHFYTLRREHRVSSEKQQRLGTRTKYVGTEVFLSFVNLGNLPQERQLQQISIDALCTNRDLPILIPIKQADGDFISDKTVPVRGIRALRAPTKPITPILDKEMAWRLISHLSLNILSLTDTTPEEGAQALRQMLQLYGMDKQSAMHKQISGIRSVDVQSIVRRIPSGGPITMGRGVEITLTCDEQYFEEISPFILTAVLDEFFARHVSINSFIETVLHVVGRGEVMRWKSRQGRRPIV